MKFGFAAVAIGVALLIPSQPASAEDAVLLARGEAVYQSSCVACHGEKGGGSDYYSDALVGDASIGELAEIIGDTMPEEDPDACVGDDAAAVAAYIHHAFYGEAAQLRNRPPRTALSRLTGRQFRQSLADLFARRDTYPVTEDRRGLEGLYYNGRRHKKEELKIERLDPRIEFDFGHDGPGEGITPEEFSIRWSGALVPTHSGIHELILHTSCSAVLHFGGSDRVLFNNHVQSAGREEFRAALHLEAGRPYPIRLDFRQRKRKTEQPPARVRLAWIPPGGVEETIPSDYLIPGWTPASFALQTSLPADDRSYGYARGITVDRAWEDATTLAAIEFAGEMATEVYSRFRRQFKKRDESGGQAPDERAALREFLHQTIRQAFRGRLDQTAKELYVESALAAEPDDATAIKRSLLMAIKSPRFQYPLIDRDRPRSHRVATRLALTFFDSLPVEGWLTDQADRGKLDNRAAIRNAAWRMVNDRRTHAKSVEFLYHYLDLRPDEDLTKSEDLFPGFNEYLVAELRKSLDATIDRFIAGETTFAELMAADRVHTSEPLAAFYGPAWQPDPEAAVPGQSVADRERHVGVLTHPLLLGHLAYHKSTSPIHRGVFLTRHVFGRVLRPPNEAFTPLDEELHPDLTTRQRVELQTGEVNCQVCHSKINPAGFAFEHFDAAGQYRLVENDQPIDASGHYVTRDGERVSFDGVRQLGEFLAVSSDARRAFVETAFEFFVKQPVAAYGDTMLDRLTATFVESDLRFPDLLVAIATESALHDTRPQSGI